MRELDDAIKDGDVASFNDRVDAVLAFMNEIE